MTNFDRPMFCAYRASSSLAGRLSDLKCLWTVFAAGREDEELGSLNEYGLCFGYVAPDTFEDQGEAYFRYQLSWGGPSDEFRFFVNPDLTCHRIEYWFLDWSDGVHCVLSGDSRQLLLDIFEWFSANGLARTAYEENSL
jgi:hypothetical protein